MASTGLCHEFARTGQCHRLNCRFRHMIQETRNNNERRQPRPHVRPEEPDKMLREWKYDSVLRNSSLWRVDGKLESFMTRAGNLIEANAGCMQDVIRTLAQEEGLAIIRFLLESRFETTFASQFIPLLRAITPDNVFRSYILEMDLGTIYKSMFGIDGSRASTTLEKIHNFLVKNVAENTCISQLEVSLLFFSRILDLNSTALIQQSLHDLAKKFDELLVTVKNEHGIDQLHQSFANMARVQRRLQVGNMIPTASSVTTNSKDSQMPSADKPKGPGGRHDNDHADICNIDIMPSFEEIASIQPEYLPAMNPAQWHLGGFDGLLDRNFRLLREDTVGQLRDAIHHFIYKPSSEPSKNDLRNNVYRNATVEKCCLSSLTRLELEVNFPQPAPAAVLATAARAAWWQDSRRLRPGNLVCLVTQKLTKILFCTVSEMRSPSSATGERGESPGIGLWKRQKVASIVLVLVEHKDTQVRTALELYEGTGIDLSLIEFPHVLLPSFEPTLKALQSMKRNAAMPFPGLFLPKQAGSSDSSESMPPLYSLQPGFNYDIASLMRDGKEFLVHPFKPVDLQRLKDGSDMDHAQAEALVHCLQHRISLIQGPPGTGKSYTGVALIKALLNGIDRRETCLGPILCVTFTNHALDQLLESLLNNKVTSKIVRIGGRSQSDKMTSLSLRNVSKDLEKTKMEKSAIAEVRGTLARHQTSFDNIHIGKEIPFDELVGFLRIYYPHHYNQLFEYGDRDGDQEPSSAILTWKDSGLKSKDEPRTLETLQRANLTNMSHSERQILHDHWVEEIWQSANAEAVHVVKSHAQAKVRFTGIQDEVNLRCLHEAKVVGATTTGLARRLKMVQNLQCKVIICEEAGEVLEPQLLTALLPEVEHLILIGDHQQLPPHVQSYDLSRDNHQNGWKYSLDVSLFERLVNSNPNRMGCGLPFKMLEMQRRMHPSIAQLVRDTSYPNIEDHPDVYNYPEVPGIKKRLFWFDHRKLEGGLSNGSEVSTSCWNEFEVDMIAALVHHLTQQGTYHEQDIAVLTPYLGQLHRLTQRLRGSAVLALNERDQEELKKAGFEDIEDNSAIVKTPLSKVLRLSTVDNFQGEEAKVVVISLVRSNLALNCGFLRSSQRNNVLLSRAQHGMYLIGNSETFGQIDMWAHVQRLLRQGNNIGPKLELQCPRHPETPIVVSKPEDFLKFSPEGGCHLKCAKRLACGHTCRQSCHSDILHGAVMCLEPCNRSREGCDHECLSLCGEQCPDKCMFMVQSKDRRLRCGHSTKKSLPCWQNQDPSSVQLCSKNVQKTAPRCGHTVTVECHVDVKSLEYRCDAECRQVLPCGHNCTRKCCIDKNEREDDESQTIHGKCQRVCGRNLTTCAHSCAALCHGNEPCPPCRAKCQVACAHSQCPKLCFEPCAPCAAIICLSACPHSQCSMPCAAPCDHVPCSLRCVKILKCGHQCPSVCGETCPPSSFCQVCATDDIKNRQVDYYTGATYKDTNLDEDPCIFPQCGHFLALTSMDAQMDLKNHYELDADGKPTALLKSSQPFSMEDMKTCGICRGPLRNLARYGRLIRRALLDESTKKLILLLNREFVPLAKSLADGIQELRNNRHPEMSRWPAVQIKGQSLAQIKEMVGVMNSVSPRRWANMLDLRVRIMKYLANIRPQEQPFQKVWEMVIMAKRQKKTTGDFEFDNGILQVKGLLQGAALSLRLDIALLSDFLALEKSTITKDQVLQIDLEHLRCDCRHLTGKAISGERRVHQVEGLIFEAELYALERAYVSREVGDIYLQKGAHCVSEARKVCQAYPGQTSGLPSEIENAEKMLLEGRFYAGVTSQERMDIIEAMAVTFQGSGHWYYCRNNHPFTIGECGAPMEEASCPECGAPVGGQDHMPVTGVVRAEDYDTQS